MHINETPTLLKIFYKFMGTFAKKLKSNSNEMVTRIDNLLISQINKSNDFHSTLLIEIQNEYLPTIMENGDLTNAVNDMLNSD
jgi:hypothetical protein